MGEIIFEFEGKKFSVPMEAYEQGLPIKLPDGRMLEVEKWLESMPPQPWGLRLMECVEATAVKKGRK